MKPLAIIGVIIGVTGAVLLNGLPAQKLAGKGVTLDQNKSVEWTGGYTKAVYDTASGELEIGQFSTTSVGYIAYAPAYSEFSSTTLQMVDYPARYIYPKEPPVGYTLVMQIGEQSFKTFKQDKKEYAEEITKEEYKALGGKVQVEPTLNALNAVAL
jgi:hypothetical protein